MADRPEAMQKFFDRRSENYNQHMRENVAGFEGFYRVVAQPIPVSDHHLLPDPKLDLYQKILKSLKPGGLYIEEDYVISGETKREMQSAYDALSEKYGAVGDGLYHPDLPLTLPIQKMLLLEAGFLAVRERWKQAEAVVLSAEKDHLNRRKQRRVGS